MKITYVCHACVLVEHEGVRVLVDPFFTDFAATKRSCPGVVDPDVIFLTHGHDDHIGSIGLVAGRNTLIVALPELCSYLAKKGLKNFHSVNFGGTDEKKGVVFSFVPAVHSSASDNVYLGSPAGVVFTLGSKTFYHMGDTDLFGDMAFIQKFHRPNVAFVPIGGRYTMTAEKAAFCCNEFFSFDLVVPIHYNTFPGIEADPIAFQRAVNSVVLPLKPFETFDLK